MPPKGLFLYRNSKTCSVLLTPEIAEGTQQNIKSLMHSHGDEHGLVRQMLPVHRANLVTMHQSFSTGMNGVYVCITYVTCRLSYKYYVFMHMMNYISLIPQLMLKPISMFLLFLWF